MVQSHKPGFSGLDLTGHETGKFFASQLLNGLETGLPECLIFRECRDLLQ